MTRAKILVVLSVVTLAAAVASGVTLGAQKRGGASQAERGRAVYEAKRVRCHGADGAGHTRMADIVEPPDMTDAAWQRRRSNAKMIASVGPGFANMSPIT